MTIEITTPDGVVEFPDGTPAETIETALKEKFGEEKARKGILGYLDDAARAIAQGVTFGRADEIGAAVNPAINRVLGLEAPASYEDALAQERARDEGINPYLRAGGEMAGAVGATIAAAPLAGAAAAMAPARVAQGVAALPRAVQFAGLGAAEGALMGSGLAVEGERLQGAGEGAIAGGITGAAAPVVASGVAGLVNRLRNAFRPQSQAAYDIGRALTRDEDTPAEIANRLADISQERPGVATIADVGGENVRGLVERVAQTPGAGRTIVIPRLTAKQRTQAVRIGRDLRQLMGVDRTAFQATQDVMAARARTAAPFYRQAYERYAGQLRSPELDRLLSADEVVQALKAAVKKSRGRSVAEGFGSFNPRINITDAGLKPLSGADRRIPHPNLQLWDYAKRELDDMAGAAARAGRNNEASYIRGLVRQLRGELDRLTTDPDTGQSIYRAARDAWAGPSAYLDALEAGRDILSSRVSAEAMQGAFDALGAAEQEAFREGAVSAIIAKMGNYSANLGDLTRFLRSPEMRQKIAAIMPTMDLARTWLTRLEYEIGASELTGQALRNSATARRLAEQEARTAVGDLVLDAFSGAGSVTMLRRILTAGPRWLRDTVRSRADKELGDLLTNPYRTQDLQNALNRAAVQAQPPSALTSAATTAAGVPLPIGP